MGQEYKNNAKTIYPWCFSGHGDQEIWVLVKKFCHTPRKIFLVHGDGDVINAFRSNLREHFRTEKLPLTKESFNLD